jgi:hypothetical protein
LGVPLVVPGPNGGDAVVVGVDVLQGCGIDVTLPPFAGMSLSEMDSIVAQFIKE